ncbi:uncharacterized protein [Epargyreus clarus]
MSFNMLTKPDHRSKAHRKSQNKFFHLFKTGKCLRTQGEDEDDPPYMIATMVKSDKVNSESQDSYDKRNISLLQNKRNSKTLDVVTRQPVIFLGKCKPGGCLDPPFGEERYQYQPSVKLQQEPVLKNKENFEIATSEKTMAGRTKRSEIAMKISNHEEIDTFTTFMLYKSKSEKSSLDEKYSDSIITYPPDTSYQDIGSLDKNMMGRKSSNVNKRLSSNATNTYFMPPKIERSPERNINRNKININSHKEESNIYYRSNDISVPEDRRANSLLLEHNNLHLTEVDTNFELNVEETRETVSTLKIKIDESYKVHENANKEITVDSQNDFHVYEPIYQSIIDTKSQKSRLHTEDLNQFNQCRASIEDLISKTVGVSEKISPILENNIFPEVDNNTKCESFTAIQTGEDKLSKQINVENKINDDLAQKSLKPQTVNHQVNIAVSEVTKLAVIQTPPYAMETSSSNKSNLAHIKLKNNDSEIKLNLPHTTKNDTTELNIAGSQEKQYKDLIITSSMDDKNLPEPQFKYGDDLKPQIVNNKSSDLNIQTKLLGSDLIDNLKPQIINNKISDIDIPTKLSRTGFVDDIKPQVVNNKSSDLDIQTKLSGSMFVDGLKPQIDSNKSSVLEIKTKLSRSGFVDDIKTQTFNNKSSDLDIQTKLSGSILVDGLKPQIDNHKSSVLDIQTKLSRSGFGDDIKPHIVNKKSSDLDIQTKLSESVFVDAIKSNMEIHKTKSSSTKSNLSEVITKEQANNQEENVTKTLEFLDHTLVLETNGNNDNEYDMNIKHEPKSHLILEETQSELTINRSLDKNKENASITSSKDYLNEIQSQVDRSQLEILGESVTQKKLLEENSKNKKENSDYQSGQDYKEVSDIEIDESSANTVNKLEDYKKDIISTEYVTDNISEISSNLKSCKGLNLEETSMFTTRRPSPDNFLDNVSHKRGSSINSPNKTLDEQIKNYSTENENNKNIEIDKDSIANLKNNMERETLLKNEISSQKISKNIDPFSTEDILSNTLITEQNIISPSETKKFSTDHVVQQNGSESDFPSIKYKTSSKDYKNAVIEKMVEHFNVSEKQNKISLTTPRFAEPNKIFSTKTIPTVTTGKYLNGSYDTLKPDFLSNSNVKRDVRISFDDKKLHNSKPSLENDIHKVMIVDLAFQTYVNENKEKILRTFDISKEPQRFPNDSISVVKSSLELNNKLSFAINSQTKLSIEISVDNAEGKPLEVKEANKNTGVDIHKENNKHIDIKDIEILQRSLATIYENDLIPVEKLIRNLVVEIDKIAKCRSLILNKLIATKKLKTLKPTYCNKRCGCLRK